jgi:hypothetical protein
MKKFTKVELTSGLASKKSSKAYQKAKALPRDFNGAIPKDIAKGIVRMTGISASLRNSAKEVVENGHDTSANKQQNTRRRPSNEY